METGTKAIRQESPKEERFRIFQKYHTISCFLKHRKSFVVRVGGLRVGWAGIFYPLQFFCTFRVYRWFIIYLYIYILLIIVKNCDQDIYVFQNFMSSWEMRVMNFIIIIKGRWLFWFLMYKVWFSIILFTRIGISCFLFLFWKYVF